MRVAYIDGLGKECTAEIYLEKEVYRCSIFPGSVAVIDTGTFVRYVYHHDDPITGAHIKAEQQLKQQSKYYEHRINVHAISLFNG